VLAADFVINGAGDLGIYFGERAGHGIHEVIVYMVPV
jgi:hypothetical protein